MKGLVCLFLGIILISVEAASQPDEITYQGNTVVMGYDDDNSYGPFNIGFNFTFFGNTYNEFYINSNGQLLFGMGSLESGSVQIPSLSEPNNFIAPFWDDLVIDSYGNIMYKMVGVSPNRKLIVQFNNMGFYPYPVNLGTFSVILYETNNKIQLQYRLIVLPTSAKAHGSGATIGIEDASGTVGVQYAYHNPAAINTGQAISFTPSGLTYTINPDEFYDGVYLTTNLSLPEPGITTLISPPQGAVIGSDCSFKWNYSPNASSYTLYVGQDPELVDAEAYPAGPNLTYNISGLLLDKQYYWGVFASNNTGTTWCEIKQFTTSSSPPLVPVPMTVWIEQGKDKTIKLNYTGGDASPKTAIINSLPAQGQLYQYSAGSRGIPISSAPVTVTDTSMNVIYSASDSYGNGAGNFNFKINDAGGSSPTGIITVNISPPGVPEVLYLAKGTGIEIQFDRTMSDPSGKQDQFEVKVNGNPVVPSAVELKTGDPNTILLTLATPLTGSETVLVSYIQGDVSSASGGLLFSFTDEPVVLTAQTIDFSQSLTRKYNDSPFKITATASSGMNLTYNSSNTSVATFTGNELIFHALGTSVITLRQLGNAFFAPALYTKNLTVEKGDQVITFNSLPGKTVGDADFSPRGLSSSGLPVAYSSNNLAVATIIDGKIHLVGAGSSVITASQNGNAYYNAAAPVPQTLTVSNPDAKTLSLSSVFLQGLYNSGGLMRQASDELGPHWPAGVADHITVELHSATNYLTVIYSAANVVLNTNGTAIVSIPSENNGSYYITIRHRNSIETTTAVPISFAASNISQSFGSPAEVYGGNLGLSSDGRYLIYAGDVNQDGFIDTQDYVDVDNDSYNYASGYLRSDVDGNGMVDTNDYIFIDNNNYNYIGTIHP